MNATSNHVTKMPNVLIPKVSVRNHVFYSHAIVQYFSGHFFFMIINTFSKIQIPKISKVKNIIRIYELFISRIITLVSIHFNNF